jgi:type II secretory pathway pseudopilin PulG
MVLIGVLVMLALAAAGAAQTGQRLADAQQRDNEEELLWVGEQYRMAIQAYTQQGPNGLRVLPMRLEDLVQDSRYPQTRRHLRKLYADPLSPSTSWGLIRQGNGIVGVYSQAPGEPFRKTGFTPTQTGFDNASHYADWRFVAKQNTAPANPSPAPGKAPATPSRVTR